jgi:hypothetical protein
MRSAGNAFNQLLANLWEQGAGRVFAKRKFIGRKKIDWLDSLETNFRELNDMKWKVEYWNSEKYWNWLGGNGNGKNECKNMQIWIICLNKSQTISNGTIIRVGQSRFFERVENLVYGFEKKMSVFG